MNLEWVVILEAIMGLLLGLCLLAIAFFDYFFEPGFIQQHLPLPMPTLIIVILLMGILYRLDQIWSYYQRKIAESEQQEKGPSAPVQRPQNTHPNLP